MYHNLIICALGFGLLSTAAAAQEATTAPKGDANAAAPPPFQVEAGTTESPAGAGAGDAWHISFSPYAWLTSYSGDVTARGIQVDATASFSDILEESDSVFGLMGALDMEHKGLVLQLNGAWSTADISKTQAVLRNGTLDADLKLDTLWFEFFGGYRFLDRPVGRDEETQRKFTVDGFVGGRLTAIDVKADLTARATITLPDGEVLSGGQSTSRDQSQSWFEPFVGIRMGLDLTEHWSIELRGDIGGFGVSGADFAWQAMALVGYRWRLEGWTIAAFGGYRALGQDYSNGDFAWDVITHGPLLGAELSWAF